MIDVVAGSGKRAPGDAKAYVAALKTAGRYQTDVY
jgi:sulfite reductase alpha subunit-like flavoprotein